MSTPPLGGPSNGHLSPEHEMGISLEIETHRSDSNSPEPHISPSNRSSTSPSDDANDISNHIDNDVQMSESDNASEDNASDDGDFDMEESVASQHDDAEDMRASSTDSNRVPKRKANVAEDEYIKANPELYGLRRSVRLENFSLTVTDHANASTDSPTRTTKNRE
jgi:chromodomain-helicase-DNA-binding protein 1